MPHLATAYPPAPTMWSFCWIGALGSPVVSAGAAPKATTRPRRSISQPPSGVPFASEWIATPRQISVPV